MDEGSFEVDLAALMVTKDSVRVNHTLKDIIIDGSQSGDNGSEEVATRLR